MPDKRSRGGDAAPIDLVTLQVIGQEMRAAVSLLLRLTDSIRPGSAGSERSAIDALNCSSAPMLKLAQTLEKGRCARDWSPPSSALPAWQFMVEEARSLAESAERALAYGLTEMATHLFTMSASILSRVMLALVGPPHCQAEAWQQVEAPGSYH
ncbi:hypothetical protein [Modicisalibacter sp. 'Wilcox']|uniref:hypothetical protein n=1 Tax=Modicisalibacter sp. 'Wilcox' TaxID=2679914 RepID=UPI0013D640DD|nr:hypothetical protein [Modicisalibacter sp. 'Wilcox']